MNRRSFLRTGAASTAILLATPAWSADADPQPPSDSELLSQARSAIDRHRTSDLTIRVLDQNGKPVSGVKVRLEQLQHDFLFGCNAFLVGHCATPDQEEAYRSRFATLFNYCTLGFYWAAYEIQQGQPNYAYTDQVLEWASHQKIICKGHPLVWDHPAGSPPWLPDDPQALAHLIVRRVRDLVSRFRGRIDVWDVVNEATHLPEGMNKTRMAAWGADLGPVAYSAEPLRAARVANPAATLLMNDYRTDSPYFQTLSRLRDERGFFFNVVGIQSHMHQGFWPLHKLYSLCETYHKLGLPIHFTETTILSGPKQKHSDAWDSTTPDQESAQAQAAGNFYTTLFAHPAVQAITWWDFSDYRAWQRAPAGLLRADMSPKPAYDQLLHLIKNQWWTKAEGRSDGLGLLIQRAFTGVHRITAESPTGRQSVSEVRVQHGKQNQMDIIV